MDAEQVDELGAGSVVEGLEIRLNQKRMQRLKLRYRSKAGKRIEGWGSMTTESGRTIFEPAEDAAETSRVSPEASPELAAKLATPSSPKKRKLLTKKTKQAALSGGEDAPAANTNFIVSAGPVMATRLGTPTLQGMPAPLAHIRKDSVCNLELTASDTLTPRGGSEIGGLTAPGAVDATPMPESPLGAATPMPESPLGAAAKAGIGRAGGAPLTQVVTDEWYGSYLRSHFRYISSCPYMVITAL